MGKIGWTELLLLVGILLLLFGASKLPAVGRGLGEGISEFKKTFKGDDPDSTAEPSNAEDKKS